MHPGVGFPLERYVPPSGATICDTFLPGGTIVSVSAPVVHADTGVYGPDALEFRPERWIEAEPERLRGMDRSFLSVRLLPDCLSNLDTDWSAYLVRPRCKDVYRQEHLVAGDGQVCAADLKGL